MRATCLKSLLGILAGKMRISSVLRRVRLPAVQRRLLSTEKISSQALKSVQAPIKERFKTDAKAALVTLKAKGTLDDQKIACKLETGRALKVN